METRILQLIKASEERLAEYQKEYEKAVQADREAFDCWDVANSRGFFNGLITATRIELGHLNELLCLNAKLGGE